MAKTLADLCIQHNQYIMYRPHLPRYELKSPYEVGQYTQQDLNMRRKAEILLYNNQSSKGNTLTKNQKWSLINKRATTPFNNRVCKNGNILTPSSACDVPGPPIELYLDPNVPLYNYNTNDKYYNTSSIEKRKEWDFSAKRDIEYKSKQESECFIIVYNSSKIGTTTYQFITPLALTIQGNKLDFPKLTFTQVDTINIKIINPKCFVYYSDRRVLRAQTESITLPNFDFTIQLYQGGDFSASKYIGALETKGVPLRTEQQFVYTISFSFEIITTLYDINGNAIGGQSDVTIYTEDVISNLIDQQDDFYFNEYNCVFVNPETPPFVKIGVKSSPPNSIVDIPNEFGITG